MHYPFLTVLALKSRREYTAKLTSILCRTCILDYCYADNYAPQVLEEEESEPVEQRNRSQSKVGLHPSRNSRMNRPPETARNAAAALCTTFPGLCKAKESLDLAAFTPAHLWARRKGEERKDDLKGGEDIKHLPNPLADGDTCSSRNETRRHSTHAVCRSISVDIPSGSNSS